MAARPTISAILISKNEEENIAECLATLNFCDEIIIVDSNLTALREVLPCGNTARLIRPDVSGEWDSSLTVR